MADLKPAPQSEHLTIFMLSIVTIVCVASMVILGLHGVSIDPVSNIASAAIGGIAGVTVAGKVQ